MNEFSVLMLVLVVGFACYQDGKRAGKRERDNNK